MTSGGSWPRCCRRPSRGAARGAWTCGKCSMVFCMCSGVAAPGGWCRTTCPRGRPCTNTSIGGLAMAPGNGSMPPCAPRSGKPRDAIPRPVPRLSIANRSRPPKKGAARLRCGQARAGAEAAHCRRYPGIIVGRRGPPGQSARPGGGEVGLAPTGGPVSPPASDLGGRRIHGIVGAVGTGPVGLDGEDCAAAQGPATVSGLAPQMGGGTDLGLGE